MYELSNLNDYIDAVLLNNPTAVQQQLVQLGILQDGNYTPDELKQLIVRQFRAKDGDLDLPALLDVPIELTGAYADPLVNYQLAKGNRAMIESLLLHRSLDTPLSINWSQLLEMKVGWRNAFLVLGLIIGLLFIILLIRKI